MKPEPRRDSTGQWFTTGARVRTAASPPEKPVRGTVIEFLITRVRVKWDNGRITHVRPDILAVITAEEPTP